MNYPISKIASVCGGGFSGTDRTVSHVITDSRTLPADGDTLFVAIRTANRDGHTYIDELYDRGVRGFIVEHGFDTTPYPEAGFVATGDTVAALQSLAAHHRTGFRGKVVGITGSYGKTTVKEWIAQLMPPKVTLFRSPKSYNSQIGVPLSVLMAGGNEDYIVIEAGISEPDEMTVLQRIIRPDIGIVTSVGNAHIENFESREQLLDEKLELMRDCPTVIYSDAYPEIGRWLRQDYPKAGTVVAGTDSVPAMADEFSRRNAAIAAAFWKTRGHKITPKMLAGLQPVAMRLEVREGLYNSVIVNDTYNSDINSLGIALDYLGRVAGARPKTVVMSDIVVTTGTEAETYRKAASLVEAAGIERFVGIGAAMMRHAGLFGRGAAFHRSAEDFMRSVTSADIHEHAVLIKGGARMHFDRISHALERRSHTTVMEIDLDALTHNLRLCRSRLAPGVGVMPMIKASGYGHGEFEIANALQQQGVDYLAVAFADEGVALREAGITMPIVVLNADAGSFGLMIRHRLEPEIYNFISLAEFTGLLKSHGEQQYPVHIKLDTGMHRLGFVDSDIRRLGGELAEAGRYARVATVFSHLAAADDPAQDDFTRCQIASFDRMSRQIADTLPYPVRRHIANSKGIERFQEAHFDMVRLGIGLYGIGMDGVQKVASLKTRIVNISELGADETVGYGRCGVLARRSRIATIPIGYADGLNRRLSRGAWSVLVNGHPAPIVGNVCMDSCMIDITDAGSSKLPSRTDAGNSETELSSRTDVRDLPNIQVGDEVVIFSSAPGNTVEDMADVLGTIPYEILTSTSSRIKRIYIKE